MEGSGTITSGESGAFGALDVTWAARAEPESGELTSPEELIAAAHAACFSMALSHGLAEDGTPPEKLDVDATLTFVPGTGITKVAPSVRGVVPGLDEAAFVEAAEVQGGAAEAAEETVLTGSHLSGNTQPGRYRAEAVRSSRASV